MFFLVVVFGLFHGMVYFPTLLSLIGPKAYSTTSKRKDSLERSKSPNSIANEKHSDASIENGSVTANGNVTANGSTVVENTYITKNDGKISSKLFLPLDESPPFHICTGISDELLDRWSFHYIF